LKSSNKKIKNLDPSLNQDYFSVIEIDLDKMLGIKESRNIKKPRLIQEYVGRYFNYGLKSMKNNIAEFKRKYPNELNNELFVLYEKIYLNMKKAGANSRKYFKIFQDNSARLYKLFKDKLDRYDYNDFKSFADAFHGFEEKPISSPTKYYRDESAEERIYNNIILDPKWTSIYFDNKNEY
jgi:hypothetical protein